MGERRHLCAGVPWGAPFGKHLLRFSGLSASLGDFPRRPIPMGPLWHVSGGWSRHGACENSMFTDDSCLVFDDLVLFGVGVSAF